MTVKPCINGKALPVGVCAGGVLEAEGLRVLGYAVDVLGAREGKVQGHGAGSVGFRVCVPPEGFLPHARLSLLAIHLKMFF